MIRLILAFVTLLANIAIAAPGDRAINNPNTDGDLSLCVYPGGVQTCRVIIDGSTD